MATIEIGDYVLYEGSPFISDKEETPTINMEIIKVAGIDSNFFIDKDNNPREKFRARTIFRKKQKFENDDYNLEQIEEDLAEFVEKFKRREYVKNL